MVLRGEGADFHGSNDIRDDISESIAGRGPWYLLSFPCVLIHLICIVCLEWPRQGNGGKLLVRIS